MLMFSFIFQFFATTTMSWSCKAHKMKLYLIICAALTILLSHLSVAVIFKLTNVVCESYNKSWFVFNQCRLRAVSRNKVVLNLNGTLLHPVNDIQAHYTMFKRENGYKPWLINNKLDCCRFWRKHYDPFYKIVASLLSEFTNMNHTCPYVGPQILKGFYLKPELLLLPFPTGNYMLSLRWYYDKRLQVDTNVSFEFIEDLKTGK